MIEARILETLLENDERMGIDWNLKVALIGAKRPITFPFSNWGDFLGAQDLRQFFPFGQTNVSDTTIGAGGATQQSEVSEFPVVPSGTAAFPFCNKDLWEEELSQLGIDP